MLCAASSRLGIIPEDHMLLSSESSDHSQFRSGRYLRSGSVEGPPKASLGSRSSDADKCHKILEVYKNGIL